MSKVVTKINWDGHEVIYTWIPDKNLENYSPITQVYGVCFNKNGEILAIKDKKWQIPGGTPEKDETLVDALKRELIEEGRIEVINIKPLGVQKVSFPNNPNKEEGDLYYQARFIAEIKEMHQTGHDPATGREYERKFIPIKEIGEYIEWREVGVEMFKDAWRLFKNR